MANEKNNEQPKFKSVDDYRDYYGDEADVLTDQQITEAVFEDHRKTERFSGINFYSWSNAFNKNSNPYSNIDQYKKTNKENMPELSTMDNLEISDRAYTELTTYGGKNLPVFRDFLNAFSPKKIIKKKYVPTGTGQGEFQPYVADINMYSTEEIAKKFNVDTEPNELKVAKARFGLDLATSEGQGLKFAKKALEKKFEQNIEIRRGPKTNEIEFYNPKLKKYQLLNKPGLNPTDMVTLADDGFVMLVDIMAQISGGFAGVGGGPAGIVVGASTASGFAVPYATFLEDAYGEYITSDKNISWSQAMDNARKRNPDNFSTLSAVLTGVGLKAGDTLKWLKGKASGEKQLTGAALKNLLINPDQVDDALKLLASIRKREAQLGLKSKTNFTIAEMADDVELLAKQVAYERNPFYGVRGKFDEFNKKRADDLNSYFNSARKRFSNKSVRGNDFESQKILDDLIKDIFEKRQNERMKDALNLQKKADVDLTNTSARLSDGSFKDAGEQITNGIEAVFNTLNKEFVDSYSKLYNMRIGGKNAIDRKVGKDEIQKVYDDFLKKKETSQVLIDDLPFKNPSNVDGYTINELKETLSDLLVIERDKFTKGIVYPDGFPRKFINAIQNQLKKDLPPDDPWLLDYRQLSNDYANFMDRFDGVANSILKIKNGKLKIQNEDVFETYFKKGKGQDTRVKQIVDILSGKQSNLEAFRASTENFYKQFITKPDGSFDINKHNVFMKDYGRSLKIVFPNIDKFDDMGNVLKAFNKSNKTYENTINGLSKSTGGKLLSADPGDIMNLIYKQENPALLESVVNQIKNNKQTLNALKTRVIDDMYNSSVKSGTVNNFDSIKFINNYTKNKKKLEVLFKDDPVFMQDLNNFAKGWEIMNRSVSMPKGEDGIPAFIRQVLRTNVAPPLTQRGRALTAIQSTMESTMGQRIAHILMDPDALKTFNKFMKLHNKVAKNPKSIENQRIIQGMVYKKLLYSVFPQYLFKKEIFDLYPQEQTDDMKANEIMNELNLPNTSENLSQRTIDVAQMDMPPAQTNNVASAPVDNTQGIAALPQGQGSGTTAPGSNAQTIARMEQFGSPFFNRG